MERSTKVREERIPVAVLGATGAVGQRFVSLLEDHPWFELREVLASPRSAGKSYGDAMDWLVPAKLPADAAQLKVRALGSTVESRLCFSALDASVAKEAEEDLARLGKIVCSNAGSWRMDPTVPLIVPEINPEHLELLNKQTAWSGSILCNPNCSTIGLTLALKPILDRFGIKRVSVVTMQAISGAGTPSIKTLDMLANVIPHIAGEEEKLEREAFKILGSAFDLSAQCNRVPVIDGHTLCVNVELEEAATREELLATWRGFKALPQELKLPTAPAPLIHLAEDEFGPQPMLHREAGNGMAIHIGRVRERSRKEWLFTTLSHNTVRGAAGGAILLAELALETGRI
ncbi:MAG: aspartate-semialdehyde dehydrogenase [Planctomycetota bacterium]|jgi:aspartate-semialdehyde dehydrogenase